MKHFNRQNYTRYRKDLESSIKTIKPQEDKREYTRDELIVKYIPLVEKVARTFSTTDQASGVMSINDLIQEGTIGLINSVDRIEWSTILESAHPEKTLHSFFSKRIKGAIRRQIDINRGNIRIPEHKLNEIRKNPEDKKMVAMFFNSMFLSIDVPAYNDEEENIAYQIPDKTEPYNIQLLNVYLRGLMSKYLNSMEYEVLRLSYGLDCDKHSAKEIAEKCSITGVSSYVRVSEIKRKAVRKLIESVDPAQVLNYL